MYVFLSYQTRDLSSAERLTEALRRERPDIEVFLAPRVLTAGAYWLPRLAEELAKADAVLFLVGQRIGPWQELEYYEAQRLARQPDRLGRPAILPVIMAGQAPGLPFLDLLHRVFAPDPAQPDTIAAVLAGLAGGTSATSEPAWKQFNPYKGLPALTSADAAFFFGREEETAAILDVLRLDHERVIVLVGASGVGKSSVAQAGVLAALRSQLWPGDPGRAWPAELAESRTWLQLTVRPGEAPLKELALAFVRLVVDKGYDQDRDADGWVQRFKEGARLADLLRFVRDELNARTGSDTLRHFVLYVDQGEELYSRASPTDARRFSALLAEAARLPDFHVLASLRADYYGQLQSDTALFSAAQRIDIPPLSEDRLASIIRRPSERLGARFDTAEMPARIAAATASEPGALPLLSYLLSDMWLAMQSRDDGVLRWLERPELIDIAAPLRDRAERFRLQHAEREPALRSLFTLRLAHVPREGQAVRRRAHRGECSAEEWAIAEILAGPEWRLLSLSAPEVGFEPIAEVAHEQLLRKWPTLRRWLDEQRDFLIWKGEIEADRREWEKLPQPERLTGLLAGRRLSRARQWLGSRADDIAAADRAYINESDTAEIEERNTELLREQRLKEAELQAALERAAATRKMTRRTAVAVGALSATGGVASWFGYRARQSDQQRLRVESDLESQLADLRTFWAQRGEDAIPGAFDSAEEILQTPDSAPSGSNAPLSTWGITAVGADTSPYTGKGCLVALLGTGIDASHPAFRGLMLVRKDFTGGGNEDVHGHDTHTAGTIFGRVVGNRRIGVAPGVTEVLVGKVLDDRGTGPSGAILAALQWASTHPRRPDVICVPSGLDYVAVMSAIMRTGPPNDLDVARGLREYLQLLRTYQSLSVVAASIGKGAVLVMPAGNDSQPGVRVPVTSPMSVAQGVIAVGSVEQSPAGYKVSDFSNALPNLCAPGHDIPSAAIGGRIATLTGTSMACAHAAGVAALWWECLRSQRPGTEVTSRMVVDAMMKGVRSDVFAQDVEDVDRGAGLVQAPLS